MYKVFFKLKEKEYEVKAMSLDLTHPYFVSIKDLAFDPPNRLIIDPAMDELRKRFSKSKHLMIPISQVSLIEEIEEDSSKVIPFVGD